MLALCTISAFLEAFRHLTNKRSLRSRYTDGRNADTMAEEYQVHQYAEGWELNRTRLVPIHILHAPTKHALSSPTIQTYMLCACCSW
jgi:hypothetical protein